MLTASSEEKVQRLPYRSTSGDASVEAASSDSAVYPCSPAARLPFPEIVDQSPVAGKCGIACAVAP